MPVAQTKKSKSTLSMAQTKKSKSTLSIETDPKSVTPAQCVEVFLTSAWM